MGGGSVALWVAQNYPKVRLFINDKDDLISALWRVIVAGADDLERLIERINVKPTVPLWEEIKASTPTTDVDKAWKAVFLNRTSYNGMIYHSSPIGGRDQQGKKDSTKGVWLIDCQYNPPRLATLMRWYHSLLGGRTAVGCEDAVTWMKPRSVMPTFIDPPYFSEIGQNNLYGVQMSADDHKALAEQMRTMRRWFMTYDFSGVIAKNLYFGFDKRVVDVRYSSPSARKSGTWKQDAELVALHGFKA
jgi:DNA adenine methylase